MDTIRPVTFRSENLAQLGLLAIAPRSVLVAAQVAVKTEVTGQLKRPDSSNGRKASLITAGTASKMEWTEAIHE